MAPSALEALRSYHWPGNVRELANVIERAVITTTDAVLQISKITETLRQRRRTGRVRLWKRWSESTSPRERSYGPGLHPSTLRSRRQAKDSDSETQSH